MAYLLPAGNQGMHYERRNLIWDTLIKTNDEATIYRQTLDITKFPFKRVISLRISYIRVASRGLIAI
jgi:hypothetical protein